MNVETNKRLREYQEAITEVSEVESSHVVKVSSKYESIRRAIKTFKPATPFSVVLAATSSYEKFFTHCKTIAISIIEKGSAIDESKSIVERRGSLGLGQFRPNTVDPGKITDSTKLRRILEECREPRHR